MSANKQIYIPALKIKGSFIEEIGNSENRVVYPGSGFEITLSAEDFENPEDYHTTWINITKAVKAKIQKNETGGAS